MFNTKNLPIPSVKVGAARVGACDPNAASKFSPGNCSVGTDAPILVGVDNDLLMRQQSNQGMFGTLDATANSVAGVPTGTITLVAGPAGTKVLAAFSFSASCCWKGAGLYLSQNFVDAFTNASIDVSVVALYAGNAYSLNVLGYGQGNTNNLPAEMFTDPRQNCCPLIDEQSVAAGSGYVAQLEFTYLAVLGANLVVPIKAAMFGYGN